VSRLARNSTDWHRLLEICALTDTLILDEDGIYDPAHFNDRLLLGLKGTMADAALKLLDQRFAGMYAATGRPSIPPERLLRTLLQVLYSVRSERLLMEQLDYNLLFRWFVGLRIDDPVWEATVFSKNRDRLLKGEVAEVFFAAVLAVVVFEVITYRAFLLARAADNPAAQLLFSEQGEGALDQVKPGSAGGREVQMKARMTQQPMSTPN
jgi:Transposase domain (DUF772)